MRIPEFNKLTRSALICFFAVMAVALLKIVFKSFDFAQYETAILTAVMAWVVNTLREALK